MASILDRYKQQVAEDKENENYEFPENFDFNVDESYKEEYKKELERQRGDIFSSQQQYEDQMRKSLVRITEEEGTNTIKEEEIDKITVKHFYCPECGEELISKAPPMFNPFTMERICLHECKCGKRYNLDYAYPRFVLYNKEGNEIKAYGI
jgi:rRNA maturation protein Nop10